MPSKENETPGTRQRPHAPVAHYVLTNPEAFSEFSNSASLFDCMFEDVHGPHDNTDVFVVSNTIVLSRWVT